MVQALGIIGLALAALCAYATFESRRAERTAQLQRDLLAAQRDQLVKLGAQLASQGINKELEAEVARAEVELKSRQRTLDALNAGELGNTAGFSDFFAAFGRQAMSGVWLTGFSIGNAGHELVISGRALHADLVPTYLRALNGEAMMRGRNVTEMRLAAREIAPPAATAAEPARSQRYVEFTLAAPLKAPEPAAAKGPKS